MASTSVMSRDEVDESTLAEIAKTCGISVNQIEDVYACTAMQLGYVIDRPDLWLNFVVSFGPDADVDKFCVALEKAVAFNAIFRTQIVPSSIGYVQVVTKVEHQTERRSGGLDEYLKETHTWNPEGPLFRTIFIDRTFIATIHHSIMDHYSWTLFLDVDVASIYQGLEYKPRPPFKDFIAQYRKVDESAAKAFWTTRFQGIPTVFPPVQAGKEICALEMEPRTVKLPQIGNAVPHFQVPLYIEAALALTLYSYADSERIVYNFLMSGRSGGFEETIGPTLLEVPIQVNFQRNLTVSQLIKDRAAALRQLQREPTLHYPRKKIAEVSDAAQAAASATTLLNIVPKAQKVNTEEGSGVKFDRVVRPRRECIPLYLLCQPLDDGVFYEPRHDPAYVSDEQMERLLCQFEHLLQVLTNAPQDAKLSDLDLFSSSDRAEVLKWNNVETTPPATEERTLPALFTAKAKSQPDAKAVDTGDESVTYQELDQYADRLAQELNKQGISIGDRVGFIFERSLWAIVAILGTLKAGAAVVPVNPNNKQKEAAVSSARVKAVLASSSEQANATSLASIVITVSRDTISSLPEESQAAKGPSGEDIAYIPSTDGITGASKGILLDHQSLISSLDLVIQRLGWQAESGLRVLQLAEYTSSLSISEIFGTFISGGTVVIPSKVSNGAQLSNSIESNAINSALLTPTVIRSISPGSVPGLRSLVSLGEPLDPKTSASWAKAVRLFNGWSASETAGLTTIAELKPDSIDPLNIGTPVGHSAWIVNPQDVQRLASIGGVGELVIGGPNLAKGYLKEDIKTKAAFLTSPRWAPRPDEDGVAASTQEGGRFYRSGELVKYNSDGSISFVGRQINRVKLGVHVIQFEEIENVILSSPEVRDVVTLTKVNKGRTQLFGVVSLSDNKLPADSVLQQLPADATSTQLESIRTHASSQLPPHKVPVVWLIVEKLPQTASGKLDRAAVKDWLKTVKV